MMSARMPFPALLALIALAGCGGEQAGTDASERLAAKDAVQPAAGEEAALDTPAIALTIDDLPWIGAVRPGETRADALDRLIDEVTSRNVPAIGFVNCGRVPGAEPLVRRWLDAGLMLGNHTTAHLDLNDAPLDAWLADARSCDERVKEISGESLVWFRYPYLHQGPTAERQDASLALLDELGSPIAHVTIDTSDWVLAVAYGEAVQSGDSASASAIGDAFVEHVERAFEHYRDVAREKAGRDVPHVLLLHANLLVADHVGALIDRLRSEHGIRFVTLGAAQRDSVYALPDEYMGPDGLSWLYRMPPATPEMAAWDDAEEQRLRREWR